MDQGFLLQALKDLSKELLFVYDLREKRVTFINDMYLEFELPKELVNYPQVVVEKGLIFEKDIDEFLGFEDSVRNGIEAPCYFRMYGNDKELVWCKKEFFIHKDACGEPIEAIGKIVNVQEKLEMELSLSIDPLTSCLTKQSFENVCSRYLKEEVMQRHALMIVDLDNFKAINDNLGHPFGDEVLRETGRKLKELFRNDDYIGRIGGDEFMVFIKNVPDKKVINQKAEKVVKALDVSYQGEYRAYHMSCSIGIAVTDEDSYDFKLLYNQADMALYASKNNGKNMHTYYDSNMSKGTMENKMLFEVASRGLSQHFDKQLISEIFELLAETKDIQATMQKVLQRIGERFCASRAYIFEKNPQRPQVYDNTYEWCAKGIRAEMENLQGIPFELFNEIYKMSNIEGIVYCNDMNEIEDDTVREIMMNQGIKSFLHAFIGPGEVFSCNVGLDDCDKVRVWSPIEISTMHHASRIIAQFLDYKQVIRKVNMISEERYRVLDAMNFYTYIIDVENHEISFFNKLTQKHFPNIELGGKCYEVLRGEIKECSDCPLKKIREKNVNSVQHKIYNEVLNKNLLINASKIGTFNGKESVFVSGIEI